MATIQEPMTATMDERELLSALTALKRGDFSARLPVEWTGLAGKIADAFNDVIELNERMANELDRVSRVVGKEGKISERASLGDVSGSWADSIASVNALVSDLVHPTRETARVIGAVAKGDLSQTMALEIDDRPLEGEFLRTAKTVNKMVDQLGSFASEVTRVAREVGTEGKLGGQAKVKGVAGTWKDLTDNVNLMAGNLTGQVRNIATVTTAVANGDLTKKITVDVKGEFLELKDTINTMVDQLRSFASEVTRVAREVGTEGKLGGQAKVEGVSGTWKDLTDNVNSMAGNLTGQVRNIAAVTTAVANGDLSKKITVDVKGEILELKNTVNTMVDQLSSFAAEVTRVAREVGTEGILGGQAQVKGVAGTWKDLTDSVNFMASNLTGQVRNIAEVTTAVANGDLSKKITVDVRGEILELKDTINTMVDQLRSFAAEVTRVAREVGTEGKLGGQADVRDVAGTWKDLTDSVNFMAGNLTGQVRNIAEVTTAVANGDLSKKITVDVRGEILELKDTINTMVDQLRSFAAEVTRVAREVGTEGKLGGQADVRDVAGTWKDLTDSVNFMAGNLTGQVRNIADVTKAVANGDLSKKITVDAKGEILELKSTVNTMVDQLSSFAAEVTRVAREVGTEGKLGGQAEVKGVAGTWKDLTDSVNFMASNLTGQVRNIADVTTAVANGDLSKKITVDVRGEILELKQTINTMVDQLRSFAAEVTRVAREVGTEGKLGGQADVRGVAGTWKDLTDSVNFMAGNLTGQVRNIADVTKAVANGDLSKKITVDVKGEILELKNTVNTMVDQLSSFAAEVTRVAREVGTEGKLGGQANVKGVAGTWKDLTDSVNFMAGNLTGQVRNIAEVSTAVANGDLSKKITVDVRGEILELKDTINTMVDQLRSFASEVTRVAREVGTEGKLGGQASVPGAVGTWKDLTDSVNFMAGNLTGQVRNIADVTKAVANGDMSKKITVDVKGEILELKITVNTMVDQLSSFAAEVTRVAREVGTEGKLGGQAQVKGVSGMWKELTDNVNFMAGNLTSQVRGIAKVVTAVADGNLKQKLTVEAKGEIAALADTINSMIDTLATFADQVTTVAREVGVEGKLGGQASVPGAAGTWKDLTDNVNQLAANLTTQVRAIAEVATAVTKGDLTRSIKVEALGEVAALKDNINEMIRNLKDTTLKNSEQDWLKTNLAKFSRMLQGQKDLLTVGRLILSELAPVVSAQHAVFYILDPAESQLSLLACYAFSEPDALGNRLALGEGLVGQCAFEKQKILLTNVPKDYIRITSGLGDASPLNIIVLPVIFEGQVKAVLELASFERFNPTHQAFLDQLTESIGIVLNTIEANMRTEDLLKQSQSLAKELQSRQQELQQTNQELQEKAQLLAHQNVEVERKNQEVEQARQALEEKAKQLSLTSKYKSEFLANMSHELRTPLNSLLILSDQLSKNPDGNLTLKQTEFSKTIHSSGNDLLMLINDILDLSKIESGTVVVDIGELRFSDLHDYVERTFRHVAEAKGVDFLIDLHPDLPVSLLTDSKRLQQVLKNLLSNAFKFTREGRVELLIGPAAGGWSPEHETLSRARNVLAISVSDTGIGIPPDKQQIIFEAFQQADGSTSRKYGGTGLGLAISREIARLLGGEIRLISAPGAGSTFTMYLPQVYAPQKLARKPASLPAEVQGLPATVVEAAPEPFVEATSVADEVGDDRDKIQTGDRVMLIVDNDEGFSRILLDLAREKGFKGLVTSSGAAAPALAREYKPDAITLDIRLPDISGYRVLDRMKNDPAMRHIPVYIISTDEEGASCLQMGAMGVLAKPIQTKEALEQAFDKIKTFVDHSNRQLLFVAPQSAQRQAVLDLVASDDTETTVTESVDEALELVRRRRLDCVVLQPVDLDEGILKFAEQAGAMWPDAIVPVVIYSPRELPPELDVQLRRLMQGMVVRRVASPAELLDRTSLHLHRPVAKMPESHRTMLDDLHPNSAVLANKKVLVVDDDIRNIFAITSVLERHQMAIESAETGRAAIEILQSTPDIDIVLMDIMMPEMDGLDTMRAIRRLPQFKNLPIVAVTAKAMKGDREKCIEAGAWDYLSKPIDSEQMMRVLRMALPLMLTEEYGMKADDRINILVVDDVPEKLIAIEAILEDLGQNIVSVGSGREALRRLLYQDFALILLDVNMPEMDGFETASMIRQRKKSEHTPIIFVTGFSDETHVSRGYSLGAVDYILTPVVPEVLRAKVAVFVDLYRKTELVKRQAEHQVAIAHEQAARAAAEAATRRSAFLADASTILATSLDYDATIAHSARLPVPSLADISVLRIAGANRTNPAQVACADDQIEAALHSASACPFGSVLEACSRHVMQTGKTERVAPSVLGSSPAGGPDAGNGADPSPRIAAAVVLPLIARGKVLGTLSLARTRDGSVYAPLDVSLAEDLAGRIAIAIDNANLFRKVQEGDRRKDEFLATLSHELRNPIAAISNALQCLEVGADSQALVDEARSILKRQVQHVIRLVDDLLDVSRITRGKIRLRTETVELKSMIDRAVSGVRPLVAARGHDLAVSLPATAVYLKGDPTRLEQVIGNLLHNAAKYTDPGGRIELAAELEGEQVTIRVKDTGAGISADLLPKIFDLFAQGDRTLDHSQGGLGIGLTLVRSLVVLHGGEVSAASQGPGQGTEFVVRLPVVAPADKEDAPADFSPSNGAAADGHGRRVVLVDDNVDLGTMTAVLLRSLGHDVHLCHDGPAALRAVDAVHPEIMLIDIGLPGMSGHEVARAIRQRPGRDELLLVAMTGYGQAEDRRRSRDAGFDIHLVKPVGLRALEELLRAPQPAAGAT